jgi:hypothetical protein
MTAAELLPTLQSAGVVLFVTEPPPPTTHPTAITLG